MDKAQSLQYMCCINILGMGKTEYTAWLKVKVSCLLILRTWPQLVLHELNLTNSCICCVLCCIDRTVKAGFRDGFLVAS